jgi:protein ImuB
MLHGMIGRAALYWVYRERIGADEAEPRWYLHGLFG